MRDELDGLVTSVINGNDELALLLHDVLEGCLGLKASSPDIWEGHPPDRTWAEHHVAEVLPELAYFLPTPVELAEALRRLRLGLVREHRLSVPVMRALDRYADRSVFFVLLDVLNAYDGTPERYVEVEVAMSLLADAADDVVDENRARARQAIERIRNIGEDITEGGFSLRYWANSVLSGAFDDNQAQLELDATRPSTGDQLRLDTDVKARLDAWAEKWTAEVIVFADKVDDECARHLSIWTRNADGTSTSRPVVPLGGSVVGSGDGMNPFVSLRSPMWGARLDPADLPDLLDNIFLGSYIEDWQVVPQSACTAIAYFVVHNTTDPNSLVHPEYFTHQLIKSIDRLQPLVGMLIESNPWAFRPQHQTFWWQKTISFKPEAVLV